MHNYNWVQPVSYDRALGHNCWCELCHCPISTCEVAVASCKFCNVRVHVQCVQRAKLSIEECIRDDWMCPFCRDDLKASENIFLSKLRLNNIQEERNKAQTVIAKNWRMYHCRAFFLKVIVMIRRLQAITHLRIRLLKFSHYRKEKLRPIRVTLRQANLQFTETFQRSNISSSFDTCNIVVVVMAVDNRQMTQSQSWKTEVTCLEQQKNFVRFDSSIMLGGVAATNTLVFTVLQKSSYTSRDIFLGQAAINLTLKHMWKKGGHFLLNLKDIEYLVRDSSGDFIDFQYPSSFTPHDASHKTSWGHLSVDLDMFLHMHNECGYAFMTSVDDLIRIIRKYPNCSNYSSPVILPSHHHPPLASSSNSASLQTSLSTSSIASVSSNTSPIRRKESNSMLPPLKDNKSDAKSDFRDAMNTDVSSPVKLSTSKTKSLPTSSISSSTSLSPINSPQTSPMKSAASFAKIPQKKVWMTISDDLIYFSTRLGDPVKLMLNPRQFQISIEPGSRGYTYSFFAHGYPEISISEFVREDELKWKTAFVALKSYLQPEFDGFVLEDFVAELKKYPHITKNKWKSDSKRESLEKLSTRSKRANLPN